MNSVRRDPLITYSFEPRVQLASYTDEDVFAAFKQGNTFALGILYDRYGLLVYRLAQRMLNNPPEAEDLTQEVFLSLQAHPNYQQQRGSFYNYLMMLTRSRAIDRLRSRNSWWKLLQNRGKMNDLTATNSSCHPLEKVSTEERTYQVRKALQQLSAPQRQVLELSYYEGLSHSQIAQHLNLPLGTVKTRCRRGLLKLRQALQELGQE
ncbi:MAG: sigma-70 family RNA polymerase sigma factor [Spirulinaceae cyanobacterium]